MPKQSKYIKAQVGKLKAKARMYARQVNGSKSTKGRKGWVGSASKADGKWSRVGKENPVDGDFEYFNPDLEDWSVDCGDPHVGKEASKEWAMLWDGCKEQQVDRLLDAIEKMRPAGAVKADMDEAWEVFASVQCK